MTAIITYARVRSALAAVRSLGKHGVKVVTADERRISTSFFSRYSSSHFVYPSYKSSPIAFVNFIKHYIQKNNIEVLMPISEETYVISKYKDTFDNMVHLPVPDYDKIAKANNKRYLINFADEMMIKVPQTYAIDDINDLKRVVKNVEYPVVIKMVEGRGSAGLRYVHSEKELLTEYKKVIKMFSLNSSNFPLIQEYIPGTGYGVSMLFNQGDPRAIFTHKRIREYPVTGGPSTARMSVRHAKMEKYATTLLKELEWHGVAMVEFKLDERTKEPVLMEINPRFWGSLNQAICAGVDFPYLLYTMAVEGDVQPVFTYKTGVKTRWMLGDCRGLIDYLRTNKRKEVLKDFLRFYERDLYYDDIDLSDPLPTIAELMIPMINFIKTGKLKFSPEEQR
ncbi:MAG: ATP-grasp domain-containing protein [Nitrospiraceae bacterium]|nr:ATP-grasp domain-containing protein [Nitrospiraceae bacterium]